MMERFGQYADGESFHLEIIWGIVSNLALISELFSPFFGTIKYLLGQWLPLAFVALFLQRRGAGFPPQPVIG